MAHLANCRSTKRWKDLVALMINTSKQFNEKNENWSALHKKIEQVSKAVATNSRLYFAFIHGVMTTAVSKGQLNSEWIYEVIISPKMQT